MSATVRIKTKATNLEIIKRMTKLAGWGEVEVVRNQACFSIRPHEQRHVYRNQIAIDLETGQAAFDGDHRVLHEAAGRIGQEYEAASVIQQAEAEGLSWERTTNEEGFPVVYVDMPDVDMEVTYG